MSDTMRTQFEGVKDANPRRYQTLGDLTLRDTILDVSSNEEINILFNEIILDDNYRAEEADATWAAVFDPTLDAL